MIKLIAIIEYKTLLSDEGPWRSDYVREPVALFDNEKLAEEYVKKSNLKNEKENSFNGKVCFKEASLLRGACRAEFENLGGKTYPLNPKMED